MIRTLVAKAALGIAGRAGVEMFARRCQSLPPSAVREVLRQLPSPPEAIGTLRIENVLFLRSFISSELDDKALGRSWRRALQFLRDLNAKSSPELQAKRTEGGARSFAFRIVRSPDQLAWHNS